VDSVVTDPPYELGFMGKGWDASGIAYTEEMWGEVLRVLKPGGHLLAFGGTRTYHRMACAIEDAGFEIRDSIHWIYGTGFPKSKNLGDGRGTALKPAHEPVVVARKPLVGTVAANVQRYGTGALNIDGSRVRWNGPEDAAAAAAAAAVEFANSRANGRLIQSKSIGKESRDGTNTYHPDQLSGRWPPNILLSHTPECGDACVEGCAVQEMDRQSGGASLFFPVFRYQAKPSRRERDAGCDALPEKTGAEAVDREDGSAGKDNPRAGAGRTAKTVKNFHPTVKSVDLMRWLVRLVTPADGLVLDPFTGSGTTGVAAVMEGFRFVGMEREAEYLAIANARIGNARPEMKQLSLEG